MGWQADEEARQGWLPRLESLAAVAGYGSSCSRTVKLKPRAAVTRATPGLARIRKHHEDEGFAEDGGWGE